MYQNVTVQVLGVATSLGAAAVLPATGGNKFAMLLSITAIAAGGVVFSSFTITRLIKRFV